MLLQLPLLLLCRCLEAGYDASVVCRPLVLLLVCMPISVFDSGLGCSGSADTGQQPCIDKVCLNAALLLLLLVCRCLEAGFDAWLAKPFRVEDLVKVISDSQARLQQSSSSSGSAAAAAAGGSSSSARPAAAVQH
jgi:hypothetical protein